MSRFVIDAPALVQLVRIDVHVHGAHRLVAPNSIRSAALDLLLAEVRAGELTDADALALHERMTEAKIRLLGDRVSRRTAWRIAREHGWETVREAEYLAVTLLQADALVTIDPDLAAKASGIVTLASFSDLLAN